MSSAYHSSQPNLSVKFSRVLLSFYALFTCVFAATGAPVLENVVNFSRFPHGSFEASSGLVLNDDGYFWGFSSGGQDTAGLLYRVKTDGTGWEELFSFNGTSGGWGRIFLGSDGHRRQFR